MASNDSGAAVAAATPVNAVTPIIPPSQAENKTPQEVTKANLDTPLSTTTQTAASEPVRTEASASSVNDVPVTTPAPVPTPPSNNDTSSASIPSSNSTDTNSSSSQSTGKEPSQSQPKPNEGEDENKNTTTTTVTNASNDTPNSSTASQSKVDKADEKQQNGSENVQNQEDKDKKTGEPEAKPPVVETKTSSDEKQTVATESPPINTNDTKPPSNSNPEKTPISDSEKSDKAPNSIATSTTSSTVTTSPQVEAPKVKTATTPPTTAPTTAPSKPIATIKPMVDSTTAESNDSETPMDTSTPKSNNTSSNPKSGNKRPAEDKEVSAEKKIKSSSTASSSSGGGNNKDGTKSAEQVLEYMEKTFDQRRKIITKQMPTIPELKSMYPELFMGKQLLLEFQRITKIDIDQKIQEFCVRYATAVIEMARSNKAAAPVLARWEQAKQENETLKQYWDMVTALCLLPLHFGENFVEMVLEIGEDEEVKAQGKIVPTLVARGNIFRTDEFFLIAENTIVQEFEEFTIAFASLYSSYWVFNMVYPETIENTYNYIQRCIVRQREPGAISAVCKNFTKSLQKWNKEKEGK